ncbi:23138_t:CDS:2, partial [Dentiscutata erythropus]
TSEKLKDAATTTSWATQMEEELKDKINREHKETVPTTSGIAIVPTRKITHNTPAPIPILSPNNPYIQDTSTNTKGEAQTERAEIIEVLTPNNTGLVPQKMEIESAAEELDKPAPTASKMEVLTNLKEPSLSQNTLQETPFTVVSYKKSNNKNSKKKEEEERKLTHPGQQHRVYEITSR